jgi:hypothetical protein
LQNPLEYRKMIDPLYYHQDDLKSKEQTKNPIKRASKNPNILLSIIRFVQHFNLNIRKEILISKGEINMPHFGVTSLRHLATLDFSLQKIHKVLIK